MKIIIQGLARISVSLIWAAFGFFIPAMIIGPICGITSMVFGPSGLHLAAQAAVVAVLWTCPLTALYFFSLGVGGRLPGTRPLLRYRRR